MSSWLPFVLFLVLVPLVGAGFAARARRRRRAFARGEGVRLRAVVRGDRESYPRGFTSGRLELGPHPRWTSSRGRGAPDIEFAGARVLGLDPGTMARQMRPSDAVLLVELPDGARLRVITTGDDFSLISEALAGTVAPEPGTVAPRATPKRRSAVPWWSAVLLALVAGWAAFWTWAWIAGDVVDATVIGPVDDEDQCRVQWTDAGGTVRSANSDCPGDAKIGDGLRVHAVPAPFVIATSDPTLNVVFPVGIGAAALLPSVGYALRPHLARLPMLRGRRRQLPPPPVRVGPDLGEGEVSYPAIAALQTERAAALGWTVAPVVAGKHVVPRRWWQVPSLRRGALYGLPRAAVPLLAVVFGALAGAPTWWAAATLATGDTAIAQARVHESFDGTGPFMPNDVAIRFDYSGRTVKATVVYDGRPAAGTPLTVRHSKEHPAAARVEGGGGRMDFVLATTGPFALAGLGWGPYRIERVRRLARSLWLVHREPARPWRYVRFVDPVGVPALLLFSQFDDGPPTAVVPLAPPDSVADGLAVTGTAMVHGKVQDGAPVLPVVEGRALWALTPAQAVPPEMVRDLINGYLRDPGRPPRKR